MRAEKGSSSDSVTSHKLVSLSVKCLMRSVSQQFSDLLVKNSEEESEKRI